MAFEKAVRRKAFLKLALAGATNSGKTMSALRLARGLTDRPIAVIDTENGSASLYADRPIVDARTGEVVPLDFLVQDMPAPYTAAAFLAAIKDAHAAGVGVLIIDSFSHAWEAVLEYKNQLDALGGNSYTNWNDAGHKFADVLTLVRSIPMHVICCMRSKMSYVLEENAKGKMEPKKVGMAPIVRDGTEYEFSSMFEIDAAHLCRITKERFDGVLPTEPFLATEAHGAALRAWLESGADAAPVGPTEAELQAQAAGLYETAIKTPEVIAKLKQMRAGGVATAVKVAYLKTVQPVTL